MNCSPVLPCPFLARKPEDDLNDHTRGTLCPRASVYRVVCIHYIIEMEVFMPNDLSHIIKQIQKDTIDIDAARRQAQNQRLMANQRVQEGNPDGAPYYNQEAGRLEQHAIELETEIDQLTAQKEQVETQITALEAQRATVAKEHTDRIAQIDKELAQLRGSSMML